MPQFTNFNHFKAILIPIVSTIIWFLVFWKRIVKLQNLPVYKWRVQIDKICENITNFAEKLRSAKPFDFQHVDSRQVSRTNIYCL